MPGAMISADDHVDLPYVPATVWTDRLPAALAAEGPRVVDTADGPFWEWEGERRSAHGRKIGLIDSFARAGLAGEPETGVFRPTSAKYRLQDMDNDGIQAQILFPPVGGMKFRDAQLDLACLSAFNDWFIGDFTAQAPDRLIAVPSLPQHSLETAQAELRRVMALGARAVLFDPWAGPHTPFDRYWDPLWSEIEEAGLVLQFHIGFGLHSLKSELFTWQTPAFTSVIHMQFDEMIPGLIFSEMLERHPNLRIVLAECGIGWVPYVLEMMDFMQNEWSNFYESKLTMKASDYFRRQMYVTFEAEKVGVRLIPDIGEDNVMWASDYPHGISTFPNSRTVVDEMFADSPAGIKEKVTRDNAARLYNL